jgi:hypothetical protein
MQRGSPAISPFAAIGNIEKFDLTTSFFSSLLMPDHRTKGNHCWSFGVVGETTTVEHRSNRVSWD